MPAAIIGLFNSGSSVLAEIVAALGWNLGPPYWGNHFESRSLRSELVRWWDEPNLVETVTQPERIAYLKQWLAEASLRGGPVAAKHPLLCLSAQDLPLAWGEDVKYIRAYRHLDESIAKLARRGWFKSKTDPHPAERIQRTLWDASEEFFATREHLRCDYNVLLAHPRQEIERVADFLGFTPNEKALAHAIDLVKGVPNVDISETGFWKTIPAHRRKHDTGLGEALADLFRDKTVIDFGCGDGYYVTEINKTGRCRGYDGNPTTTEVGGPDCSVLDLAQPVTLEVADWVLSLEVGEHIPRQFEDTFIENLHQHNSEGIVLSWAWPGQGGLGHCNERKQKYISSRFESLGYFRDTGVEQRLREVSRYSWFRTNILVLRRQPKQPTTEPSSVSMLQEDSSLDRSVKAHWYRFPNFGDCLTKPLLEHFGMPCEFSPVPGSELFCIGSLLEWVPEHYGGVILGQGFTHEASHRDFSNVDCFLLRGPLTQERAITKEAVAIGDPGLLVSKVFLDHRQRTFPLGIIPHYLDKSDEKLKLLLERLGDDVCFIDVQASPQTVCSQICQCESILSSSLHGIIAAHAYGIPAAWGEFGKRIAGDGFKFQDYAASIGMDLSRNWILGDESLETLEAWCSEPTSQIPAVQADIREAIIRFRDMLKL